MNNLFFKFGEKANMENLFYKGEIFMRPLLDFREEEDPERGDKFEGASKILNGNKGKLIFQTSDGKNIQIETTKFQYRELYSSHIGNIYCLYHVNSKIFKRKKIHYFDKGIKKFGDTCVVIKDCNTFLTRLISRLKEQNLKTDHGPVEYKKFNFHKSLDLNPFKKSHLYSHQHEYRIWANYPVRVNHKFEIGSLENIAEIYPSASIIENSQIMVRF